MRRRQAFTLVELLVATALIVFVMVILTEAFTASLSSFRLLKSLGDMDARLRMVRTSLVTDLNNYAIIGTGKSGVKSVTIINRGSGYTTAPTVSFMGGGGSGANATAAIGLGVISVTVNSGGTCYDPTTSVQFDPPPPGPGNVKAQGTVTVVGGVVTAVNVTEPGCGYVNPPNCYFNPPPSPPSGTQANVTVNLTGVIATVTITAIGSGYTAPPAVIFNGGGGSGATATASPYPIPSSIPRTLQQPTFWTSDGSPYQGFFRISHGSQSSGSSLYLFEGNDADGIPSRRAVDHSLHFTVWSNRDGLKNTQDSYFATSVDTTPFYSSSSLTTGKNPFRWNAVSGTVDSLDSYYQLEANTAPFKSIYTSQWMEVVYFLSPTNTATPLYSLCRQQRLILDHNITANAAGITTADLSQNTQTFGLRAASGFSVSDMTTLPHFNNPADLTTPAKRLGGGGITYTPSVDGSDILLTDVVSFEVKVIVPSSTSTIPSVSTSDPSVTGPCKILGLNDIQLPGNPPPGLRIFDTWDYGALPPSQPIIPSSAPMQISIMGLEITIRVYDFKTQQTRQITIVKNL